MGYSGVVSREHSSGERIRRDIISKTADTHLRRIVVEAAWSYRYRPAVGCEPLGFIGAVSVEIEGASRTSRPHAA